MDKLTGKQTVQRAELANLATAASQQDQVFKDASDRQHAAEVKFLQALIETIKPGLEAISSKIEGYSSFPAYGIHIGNGAHVLRNGTMAIVGWNNIRKTGDLRVVEPSEFVEGVDVLYVLEVLHTALQKQINGNLGKRTKEMLERADRLTAMLTLMQGTK